MIGKLFVRLLVLKEEKGAAAVEYGLLVGLIAAVIVATVALLGPKLNSYFVTVATALGITVS